MENSSRFYENRECEYYPCHKSENGLNCLFCYCPLYAMTNCPGDYKLIQVDGKQIKSCEDCMFPHRYENYEAIMQILKNTNQ